MINHILYIYTLQMLYFQDSEQKRVLDKRRLINKNYYYHYYYYLSGSYFFKQHGKLQAPMGELQLSVWKKKITKF